MKIDGRAWRTIWPIEDRAAGVIDQRRLPHEFATVELRSLADACEAISAMTVRGAPLIGAAAAYGLALAANADPDAAALRAAGERLCATRPTAVNLRWAVERVLARLEGLEPAARAAAAWDEAARVCDEDAEANRMIGVHGLPLIEKLAAAKDGPVNLLTHCNAGWLACVDWGTATAPVYQAHDAGVAVHVWVDETRPRGQGAFLTAWELGRHGVPHTVIADNAGGHLMQHGQVDACIVGTDRTTAAGDVCNKIGTYLKALAARDCGVPFYVALPSSSIDPALSDGIKEIPIEERSAREVTHIGGLGADGKVAEVQLTPAGSGVANPGFDVTPARLVTGLLTERGLVAADRASLAAAFPEKFGAA